MNTNQQPDREREIFEQAVEILSATERNAFLNVACVGNPALRARLDAILRAHDDASKFLPDQPAALAPTIRLPTPPDEQPGQRIGRYKLLQKIGEGGCGVVYMADQEEPVRRRVALKVIKLGMDNRLVEQKQALLKKLGEHQDLLAKIDRQLAVAP